jgi:toxin ParE1/3/4
MPGRIVRDAQADDDLVEIAAHLILEDEALALRFLRAAEAAFARLATFPHLGSRYRSDRPALANMRKWPVPGLPKHLIFYRPLANGVEVVRVLHGVRDLVALLE